MRKKRATQPAMKALVVTILTTGVLQLANLASGLLAARLLLPEGRGALAIAILWPTTLAYLLLFGLSDAVTYYSANRQERPERVFAAALWLRPSLLGDALLARHVHRHT